MTILKTMLASGVIALLSGSAMALTATQSVQKEVTIVNSDGSSTVTYQPADLVAPGERIIYSLYIENDDAQPASNLVLTMPVPSEVKYIEGSAAKIGAAVTYSADQGESFSTRETLMVLADSGVSRTASSEDITHIRWNITGSIEAGASDSLSFTGELK